MSKLDAVKETLNTLRAILAIVAAFLIAFGGVAGSLYDKGNMGLLFWLSIGLIVVFVSMGFLAMQKIAQKTKEIEEL